MWRRSGRQVEEVFASILDMIDEKNDNGSPPQVQDLLELPLLPDPLLDRRQDLLSELLMDQEKKWIFWNLREISSSFGISCHIHPAKIQHRHELKAELWNRNLLQSGDKKR